MKNRSGRKRSDRARTRSGRLSRQLVNDIGGRNPATVMRLVQESLRGCADEVYGAPLGRLFLDGKISASEFEAGRRWDRLVRRYHFAIGAPLPDPRTSALMLLDCGLPSPSPDPQSPAGAALAALDVETVEACRAAHSIILSFGSRAEEDVRRLCEGLGEFPRGFESLLRAKEALAGLARFWGLAGNF